MADDISADNATLMSIFASYRREAEEARLTRIQMNKSNYDAYHLRQDYSYKQKGQSMEFLPKVFMAVEQNANTLQQGLVDMGEWFRVYPAPGYTEAQMKVKPQEIQKILTRQLEKAGFYTKVGDLVKLGYLGAMMVAKVHGEMVPKPKYEVKTTGNSKSGYKKKLVKKEDFKWQLKIDTVRQQDWRPDPTGAGVYNLEDVYLDWYHLKKIADEPDSGFDKEAVDTLKATTGLNSALQEYEKSRETGQTLHNVNFRHRIKLTQIWGDFVDAQGNLVWENCVATIANDLTVVQPPMPIPFWHGKHPYASCPILSVPNSVWGKTPMDAATMLNIAINEFFNLILDGGLSAVHGIKQIREHWLEDPSQVEDGIPPGETLRVNTNCPPGMNAFERVDTTTIPAEVLPVYNLLMQEFNTSAMTNDMRMGVEPFKQVKATEVVESSQAITSMSTGIAKNIETALIKPILELAWPTCCQHMNDFDTGELEALLGVERAHELKNMGPEELFADSVGQAKFEVFGISATLNKKKEQMALKDMLQTLVASPALMEQFVKKYDFGKVLTELLVSGDVPIYKIETDDVLDAGTDSHQGTMPAAPNMQSQMPQANNNPAQGGPASMAQPNTGGGAIAPPNFPASRALQAEGK